MKISFKRTLTFVITLLSLIFGAAGVTPARAVKQENVSAGLSVADWEQIHALLPAIPAQQAYLKASNAEAYDYFGRVAIDRDTVVVGAPGEASSATGVNGNESDNSASLSGAVYVFTRNDGVWSQQAYLKASNTGVADGFGNSVAIDGDTIVVGAYGEDSGATGANGNETDNSASGAGAAYVFVRSGEEWNQQAYLKASNTGEGDGFGNSVAIDGDTIVVGAYGEDSGATGANGNESDNSVRESGAAYVFARSGETWSQQTYLKASNTGEFDSFGYSVAIDGDTVVVGATWEDSNATGVNGNESDNSAYQSGAAYVFFRVSGEWSQQAYLKASNTGAYDHFGAPVAIDGDTIVVGVYEEDSSATGVNGNETDNLAINSGAAYVFTRGSGEWSQQAYLKAFNTQAVDHFGSSVAVSGDMVVVGAGGEDSGATGMNGNATDNSIVNAGAAYVFVRSSGEWSQHACLKASNTGTNDGFGGVAISGDTIVVGAGNEDSGSAGVNGNESDNSAYDAGAAYVLDASAPLVYSIVRNEVSPTSEPTLDFTVKFSEPVTGVDISAFKLTNTLLSGASISGVSGSGDTYTVTVDTGTGSGTIRLDVYNTVAIQDLSGIALIGAYTGGETYTIRKGTAPTMPVLKSPAKNALVSNTPTLDWSDSSEVLALAVPGWRYEINITSANGYNETFDTVDDTDPLVGLGASSFTFVAPLPDNTTFTWKVRAYNDQNQYSAWSAPLTFRTKLGTPVLDQPANSTLLDNKRPTFTWDAVSGATSYTLQILKENPTTHLFTVVANTGTIKAPFHAYTPAVDLLPGTTYTWKVKANGTNAGDYSAPFTFTTSPNPPKVPVLISPANALLVDGAVEQTLKWGPVLGVSTTSPLTTYPAAASFEIEYATDSAFSGSTIEVVNGNTLAQTQLILPIGTLSPNLTYYWHVRSWSGVDAGEYHSAWSLTRNFRVKPATVTTKLPAPTLNLPLDNATQVVKRPAFTWTEISGASSYTLQILKGAAIVNTGTIIPPLHSYVPKADLLAGTTYTWKVKANGTIPSDFSAPLTFTVVPNSPKVPVLTLPASAALLDSAAVQTLKWGAVPAVVTTNPTTSYPAAASFEVEYATNSYFSGSTVEVVNGSTQLPLLAGTLLPNRTYYWRVRSWSEVDAAGNHSTWSVARTFRTKLETPVLNLPANGTTLDNKRPTFTWDEVPGATGYTLQILLGTKVVNTGTIKAPAYVYTPTVDLLPSTTYTWKVKANGVNAGDYSAPFTFTTSANPPKPPVLTTPANALMVDSAVLQTLKWNPVLVVTTTSAATTYPAAGSYEVEYAMNSTFTGASDTFVVINAPATQTAPISLLPGRTYYWRVRSWSGVDATGNRSAWSVARTIKVKYVVPTLTSPAADATGVAVRPTFTWDSAGNGLWTSYTLQVATNDKFTTGLRSFTINAPVTSYTIPSALPALAPNTTYYWRVKINGVYTPVTSTSQSFTTVP